MASPTPGRPSIRSDAYSRPEAASTPSRREGARRAAPRHADPAVVGDPDDLALDTGVQIATASVLGLEGVTLGQQAHRPSPAQGAGVREGDRIGSSTRLRRATKRTMLSALTSAFGLTRNWRRDPGGMALATFGTGRATMPEEKISLADQIRDKLGRRATACAAKEDGDRLRPRQLLRRLRRADPPRAG
jgi:hypothetical protein